MPRPALLLPTLVGALASFAGQVQAAAAATAPTVPIEIVISDGQRLIERWKASLYFKLWQDPASAYLRTEFGKHLDEATAKLGYDPLAALAALRGGELRLLRFDMTGDAPQPAISAQADFGEFAARIYAQGTSAMKDQGATPITLPGAAEAIQIKDQESIFARFGQVLFVGHQLTPAELVPGQAPTSEADVQASISGARYIEILKQIASKSPDFDAATLDGLAPLIGDTDYQLRIVPEGVLERVTSTAIAPYAKPVDRPLLARLPANTLLALGFGLDGKAYWKQLRTPLLTAMAKQSGATPDEFEAQVDQQLAAMGLTCSFAQLVEGFTGTTLFAVTPSAPFPAVTVALPRSPALDQVFGLLLDKLQTTAPAEGTTTLLPIPNVPVPIQIGMDKTSWLITSDAQLATDFLTGKPGGWADSPAGTLALSKATADASMVGSSDTKNVLRMITQFAGMALAVNPELSPQQRQAILQGLAKTASLVAPGYVVMGTRDGHTIFEDRGLFGLGGVAMLAGVAAVGVARKNAEVSRQSAGDPTAPLRSIMAAELAFQKGAYVDQDGNGTGEFGLLSELGGARATANAPQGTLSLVSGELAAGASDGYNVAVFLPDGHGGALGEPDGDAPRPVEKLAAKDQEQQYVAYTWPEGGGAVMFALTKSGKVYVAPYTGTPPKWNDLFGGQGWADAPTWKELEGAIGAPQAGGPTRPPTATGPGDHL